MREAGCWVAVILKLENNCRRQHPENCRAECSERRERREGGVRWGARSEFGARFGGYLSGTSRAPLSCMPSHIRVSALGFLDSVLRVTTSLAFWV